MGRSDPITLPADTAWLSDLDAQAVCAALAAEGGVVYFVGGCVRDAILERAGADFDLSTPLLPQDVTRLAEAGGFRVVPTGIEHGTVTVVAGGKGFEITTFRRDVETDGRRATVSFSTDIADDARRRDFTLNALYSTVGGRLVDPLGGLQDCQNRRIRFIEDADLRIREDYLRILRFFRFHAWYANPEDGFDKETLNAISKNTAGLDSLSRERVGMEMQKLLCAANPCPAIAVMGQTGCLSRILPGSGDRFLGPLVHLENTVNAPPDPILRLAVLGGDEVAARLRLGRKDARHLTRLIENGYGASPIIEIAYREGFDIAKSTALMRAALANAPVDLDILPIIDAASKAAFPISAKDLMPELQGKVLGERLAELERRWIASGFALTRADLLKGA